MSESTEYTLCSPLDWTI